MEGNHGDPRKQAQIEFRETKGKQESADAGENELARTSTIHRAVP